MARINLKGEVSFPVEADDGAVDSYTLVYSINALCVLEESYGIDISSIGEQLKGKPSIKTLRSIFHAGLTDHHPSLTEADAGRLMGRISLQTAADLLGQALKAAFGQGGGAGEGAARPRKPAARKRRAAGTSRTTTASGAN